MKRVLVIGANSYIGKQFNAYIHNQLADNLSLTLVSASDGSWRKCNFSDYDSVLHLSGIVHRKEKKDQEELYYNVNCRLAVEVAIRAKESHVKQFIFMSTAAVYDRNEVCITQSTVPKPRTIYGKSKLAAEKDILQLQSEDFKVAIIRLPMVYGEGCKGNYPRLVKLAKITPVFPDYHNKRSMIHIERLCEFIIELVKQESGGFYYPQDDRYYDTCELVVKLRQDMGKRTFLIKNTDSIIKALIPHNTMISKMFSDFYYQ